MEDTNIRMNANDTNKDTNIRMNANYTNKY